MNEQVKAIRAEIERRIKEYDAIIESQPDSNRSERDAWKWAEDKSLLSFIDSLPESNCPKLSDSLEEAAEEYGKKEYSHAIHFWDEGLSKNKPEVMKEDFVDAFKAGAN